MNKWERWKKMGGRIEDRHVVGLMKKLISDEENQRHTQKQWPHHHSENHNLCILSCCVSLNPQSWLSLWATPPPKKRVNKVARIQKSIKIFVLFYVIFFNFKFFIKRIVNYFVISKKKKFNYDNMVVFPPFFLRRESIAP